MIDLFGIIFMKAKNVFCYFNVIFRRDHVNMVPLHLHSILDLHNRHRRVFAENLGKQTFVVRCQMLDNYKRHPRI